MAIKISPYFTLKQKNTEKLFQWKKTDAVIKDASGKIYFEMKNVEAPSDWSQLAIDIAASKYFRKKGVPKTGSEKSVRQMVNRVVAAITHQGMKQKYFTKSEAPTFSQELKYILLSQRASFNSPVWFNCGLFESYKMKVFEHPQVSACFIQSVEDNLESIFNLVKNEARLFKFGSGSGTNFSNLRSKYEELEGGGTSSGLMAFLDVLDRGAGAVKSGGTTRRAAKMVCVDADHPEIQEFISWKAREEKKAQDLIRAGWDVEFEGEAYRTVSGQNANNSVRVSDRFMNSVLENKDWDLKERTTKKISRTVRAQDLWKQIAEAAWFCADPGLQYSDTIQSWHTCPKTAPIRASNPCSEYMFIDDSACNLASLNLTKFLNSDAGFDFQGFIHTAKILLISQEILVDYAGYPTEKIAQNAKDFRPLGLGFAGLGAFLMAKAVAYDSEKGREWASFLAATLTGVAYGTSAELAQKKKPFRGYKLNKTSMQKVLQKHHKAVKSQAKNHLPIELWNQCEEIWKNTITSGKKYGYRNAQVTVMAPTGTIGLVMDSETTGVEPEFSLLKIKKLSGGGEVQILSRALEKGLQTLKYSEAQIVDIFATLKTTGSLDNSILKKEHKPIFNSALEISPEGHLKMMSAIQPFVSGAISKTVNLHQDATIQDVADLYMQAWKLGLKSIAIYRDGCKQSQPLQSGGTKIAPKPFDESQFPKCVDCGAPTELAGGCFRCVNCGTVVGCA
ncbi:MAG: hypothetical protein BroJett040_00090 [Oligoflexia bacterium]|nr:MAG: hypothetical protein BroJett040_00090 [Oligoflexia bacterium]